MAQKVEIVSYAFPFGHPGGYSGFRVHYKFQCASGTTHTAVEEHVWPGPENIEVRNVGCSCESQTQVEFHHPMGAGRF